MATTDDIARARALDGAWTYDDQPQLTGSTSLSKLMAQPQPQAQPKRRTKAKAKGESKRQQHGRRPTEPMTKQSSAAKLAARALGRS